MNGKADTQTNYIQRKLQQVKRNTQNKRKRRREIEKDCKGYSKSYTRRRRKVRMSRSNNATHFLALGEVMVVCGDLW